MGTSKGFTNLKVGTLVLRFNLLLLDCMGRKGSRRQQGDVVFIDHIINIFQIQSASRGYVCLGKMTVSAKGILGKRGFIRANCIKGGIPEKDFEADQRVL